MRTGSDYLGDLITIEHLYIHHSLHLKEKLIAGTLSGVARATLFGAKHSKAHPCFLQEVSKGFDNTFRSVVKTTSTTYPKEYFGGFALCCEFRHCFYHTVLI